MVAAIFDKSGDQYECAHRSNPLHFLNIVPFRYGIGDRKVSMTIVR